MKIELTTDNKGLQLDAPPYKTEGLTACLLGNKGAGKSNALAIFAEEAHRNNIPFIIFDPNGDACSLAQLGEDVIIIGDQQHDEKLRRADYSPDVARAEPSEFIRMVLKDGYSLIFDLSDHSDPCALLTFNLIVQEHYRQAGKIREPAFVLVDEAHCFAPQSGASKEEQETRRTLGKVATDGRKRGMLLVAATQRATYLDKRIVFGCNVRMFGKCTYWPDYDAIKHYHPYTFDQMKQLTSGEFIVTAAGGSWGKFQIKQRSTPDLGGTPAFRAKQRKERPSKIKQLQLPIPPMRRRVAEPEPED